MARFPALVLLAFLAVACSDTSSPAPPVVQAERSLGVPKDGFPNWEERVMLVLTNRARSDPGAQSQETCGGSCASYPPTRPLVHNHGLALASRFHATSLKKAGSGLMHDSVCRLKSNLGSIYPKKCDGDPSCACEGGTANCSCGGGKPYCSCAGGACTSTWGRVSLFGVQGRGENAAAGNSDPIKTFSQWVRSSGHWSNVNKSSHFQMGAGHYGGPGKGCYSHFWVQVFGSGSATPRLPAGAHYPQRGGQGSQIRFWANYHDPAGAPKKAFVNIGGTCFPMKLERGAKQSGTYLYTHPFKIRSCHRYYFVFTARGGSRLTFPTSGSYGVDISAPQACPDHSTKLRPALGKGCGTQPPKPGPEAGAPAKKDGASARKDAAITKRDSATSTPPPDGGGGEEGGCAVVTGGGPVRLFPPGLLLLLLLGRRGLAMRLGGRV